MKLSRNSASLYGVFGQLIDDDGTPVALTLEHAFDDGQGGWMPALPAGSYICQRRRSPKFNYDVFEIMNVPGHTYIEIHIGNYNSDSDGCVLLGTSMGTGCILDSRSAFGKFMALKDGIDSFPLVVSAVPE